MINQIKRLIDIEVKSEAKQKKFITIKFMKHKVQAKASESTKSREENIDLESQ